MSIFQFQTVCSNRFELKNVTYKYIQTSFDCIFGTGLIADIVGIFVGGNDGIIGIDV